MFHLKKYLILLLMAVIILVSLAFPNRDYSYDSIEYAIEANNQAPSIHPHHLLFYPTIKAISFLFTSFGGDELFGMMPVQFMNIILFPFAVLFFYLIILNISNNIGHSIITSMIFGFSGGIWTLSLDNEVHTLPLLFLLLSIYLFISKSSVILAAMVFTLSILYHQSYILALPSIAYLVYSFLPEKRIFRAFVFSITSVFLTAGAYITAAVIEGRTSPGEIINWMLFYTESGKWGSVSLSNFFYSGAGIFQLFFAPRLIRLITFGEKIHGTEYLYLFLEVIGTLLIAVIYFILFKRGLKDNFPNNKLLNFSIIFIIPFSAFAFFWEPQNVEFWIPVFIPLLIIIPLFASSGGRRFGKDSPAGKGAGMKIIPVLCAVLFIIMFTHNRFSAFIPASNIQNNETYFFAEKISEYISDGDLLIHNKKRPVSYLKYFFKKEPDYTSLAECPLSKLKETSKIGNIINVDIEKHLNNFKKVFITSLEINPPLNDPALLGILTGNLRTNFYEKYKKKSKKIICSTNSVNNNVVYLLTHISPVK